MSKRRKKKPFRRKPHSGARPVFHKPKTVEYLLEQGTFQDMREAKARTNAELKYQWDFYSELAHQRNQIQEELKKALIQSCISGYPFKKWQRAVKWKYGLHPLSTVGSLAYIGGRFNTGSDVNSAAPSFSGLYIASNKDTALQETLGQAANGGTNPSPLEFALMNPQSEVFVSVSGEMEKVFDLRTPDCLKGFLDLIKDFTLSDAIRKEAKALGFPEPMVIKTIKQLHEALTDGGWRVNPSMFDVPANSQIFGQLVFQAGIEGILYSSKFTGDDCLCVFPHNFAVTSSYISLDDEPPHEKVPLQIDNTNWRICELSPKELIEGKTE